jgi:hypothetical protein
MTLPALPLALGETTPYQVAFLTSSAVEVIAVAALLALAVTSLTRRAPKARGKVADRRLERRGIDVMHLHKLVIPVVSLGVTIWIWTATRGA